LSLILLLDTDVVEDDVEIEIDGVVDLSLVLLGTDIVDDDDLEIQIDDMVDVELEVGESIDLRREVERIDRPRGRIIGDIDGEKDEKLVALLIEVESQLSCFGVLSKLLAVVLVDVIVLPPKDELGDSFRTGNDPNIDVSRS